MTYSLRDSLGMEVGYRLIPMVDFQQDGELPDVHSQHSQKIRAVMAVPAASIHIRDNMDLQPARYRI